MFNQDVCIHMHTHTHTNTHTHRYTKSDGEVYEGSFNQGKRSGFGKITYVNGDVYEGDVDEGLPFGEGMYAYYTFTEKRDVNEERRHAGILYVHTCTCTCTHVKYMLIVYTHEKECRTLCVSIHECTKNI